MAMPTWNAVADAPTADVEKCIRISGLSRIKAPRIQTILRQVRATRGRISLEFLKAMPPEDAYSYLRAFAGVGPKTASCVLLFSLGMPLFPVDTHVLRIARRLELANVRTDAEELQEMLTPLIPPADRYAMHILLITHGRRTCAARSLRCRHCQLLELCPTGKRGIH